jgi:hypothetical protein
VQSPQSAKVAFRGQERAERHDAAWEKNLEQHSGRCRRGNGPFETSLVEWTSSMGKRGGQGWLEWLILRGRLVMEKKSKPVKGKKTAPVKPLMKRADLPAVKPLIRF